MNARNILTTSVLCLGMCWRMAAQWQHVPVEPVPRTADGKPNLTAPAPRTAAGRPDLSGVWGLPQNSIKYVRNLAADFKPGELPIQPWAEALTKERMTGAHAREFPPGQCLPPGIPVADESGAANFPLKIIQQPTLLVILYEVSPFRQIFLDGRAPSDDANPSWLGYSVGRWEGDTLVVETTGFNGKMWLDLAGHPTTEALHITERFRRRDFGHLELTLTIDDPKAYTKPWTVTETLEFFADTDLLEYVCNENEKDLQHLK